MRRVLVTGAAGFIGFHTSLKLLAAGAEVVGVDNLNDYYDPALKQARLARLQAQAGFSFQHADIADPAQLQAVFAAAAPERVLHLAAQAGVRYSLHNPQAYVQSNLVGFGNLLECCRHHQIEHLVFASSSSVYGANAKVPFAVTDTTDHPVSLYAATKKANEAMAHAYAHLYRIPCTGLRFFTVYGPWGRPDMAYFSFTKAILEGRPIKVFNRGDMRRDFTYIDDIVRGVVAVLDQPAAPDTGWSAHAPVIGRSSAPYRLYNIGNHSPVRLMDFIQTLERLLGTQANMVMEGMAPGDVYQTYADVSDLAEATGFAPDTPLETGLAAFVDWYRDYFRP